MTNLDWLILLLVIFVVVLVGWLTSRHMKGVSDFLAANRLAGRYMLTISAQVAGTGLVSVIGAFEMVGEAGFTPAWWALMNLPIMMVVALTGFFFYRYRETRVLTLAQFFEKRYSANFRKFAGTACFLTGLVNFGVFPVVSARFYVHFLGLPELFYLPGIPFGISSFAAVMLLDLSIALLIVLRGGQISVMVTDCVQGMFSLIGFVIFALAVLWVVSWADIETAIRAATSEPSLIDPMRTAGHRNFNMWFFVIGGISGVFSMVAWQGSQGYNASARNPHEQKMGQIIGSWRWSVTSWMAMVLAMGTFAVMTLPDYSAIAETVQMKLADISNTTLRGQMMVPLVLTEILPVGVKGLFFAVMVFLSITTHNTYLHSWGSIFIQDVFIPITGKTFTPEKHIRLLRRSILGVALYAFVFGMFYSPSVPVFMYWAITGALWLPGAGAAVIGGLYWRRGTTAAAYCALCFGIVVGIFGLVIPRWYQNQTGQLFPLNNQYLFFIGIVGSVLLYVIVSLLSGKGHRFNLERLLHRGVWAVEGEHALHTEIRISPWQRLVGITHEFSLVDRILAVALVVWNLGWVSLFGVVTLLNLFTSLGDDWWMKFWKGYVWFYLAFNVLLAVWFTVGGVMDIRFLMRTIKNVVRDETDDGRVRSESEKNN